MYIDDLRHAIENLARRVRALEVREIVPNYSSTTAVYLGDSSTDGSWRMVRSGNNLVFERREGGAWVIKQTITP